MPSENTVKVALMVSLAFALLAYHAIQVFVVELVPRLLFELVKVAQLTTTAALFFAFLYWPPFVRLALRKKYIGGTWKGESFVEKEKDVFSHSAAEEFSVEQDTFQATFSGRSYDGNGNVKSIWTGRLYRVEGQRFWFAMELSTSAVEVGILQFSKQGEHIDGLYHPGNPDSPEVFRFCAEC